MTHDKYDPEAIRQQAIRVMAWYDALPLVERQFVNMCGVRAWNDFARSGVRSLKLWLDAPQNARYAQRMEELYK